jgi:hypothetical protein
MQIDEEYRNTEASELAVSVQLSASDYRELGFSVNIEIKSR